MPPPAGEPVTPGGARVRGRRALLAAGVVVAVLVGLRLSVWQPRAVVGAAPDDGWVRVPGVLHVHTVLSDGGGTAEDVARAARDAALGFVVVNDHNTLAAKPFEGVHDGVLVLVGTEISTDRGHVLGFGLDAPTFRFSGDAEDALDDVRVLGGWPAAAHPASPRAEFVFSGWDLPGPWGVEVLNGDSGWRRAGWASRVASSVVYLVQPRSALLWALGSPDRALQRWDALLAERDVAGLGGADAHSRIPLGRGAALRLPSYRALFSLIRHYVLLREPLSGDAARDSAAVLEALRSGRGYVGVEALAPAGGFSFEARVGERRVAMGETVIPDPRLTFHVGGRLPEGARVRLLHDGRVYAEGTGPLSMPGEGTGVYRVEVRISGWDVPWVVSNPIYVFDAAQARARRERAAWPEPTPAPTPLRIVEDFESGSAFAPEHDPTSSMAGSGRAAGEGVDGGAAGRLAFRLGIPGDAQPHTWCALVDRTPPTDLDGAHGLSFSIRADGVYRVWVQVRDANPAAETDGVEWWFASVRTGTAWRRVGLPLSRFRSLDPGSDGHVDLDRLRALVFVLDRGAVEPGTSGTVWLDDVGVY